MVLKRTQILILDNSGARVARCIRVFRKQRNCPASVGDQLQVNIVSLTPNKKVQRKLLYTALVVGSARKWHRRNRSSLRFDKTIRVLIDKTRQPLGTRIFTPISKELRKRSLLKLTSLARRTC